MNTYWLAIDTKYTSYLELKHRKVIAQGWPDLGDLTLLSKLVKTNNRKEFIAIVETLEIISYGDKSHAATVMWNLLNMKRGDLIVGIEGTTVKGICQLNKNGDESYKYLFPHVYNYAQTIGFSVEWEDWDSSKFGFTPTPPAQSVQGIAGLVQESSKVIDFWRNYKQIKP